MADSGNAPSAATPSAPTLSGPRNSQTSSTSPAATKDDATPRPALDHQPRDALFRERAQHRRQIEARRPREQQPRGSPARRPRPVSSPRPLPPVSDAATQSGVCRAECTSLLAPGIRSARSSTTRTGERASMPGSRQVSSGSSASTVPIPTRIASLWARSRCTRVFAASPVMATGLWPAAAILSSAETASFRITCGRLSRMRRKCPAWSCAASAAQSPTSTAIPAARSFGVPLPCHFRIGILDRRHHARNAGGDDGIDAGRRLAEMRARLQRHIERGAARGLACTPQRLGLGMRPAAGLRPAAADDDAILHHDRADGRIGPGAALPAPAERQRQLHVALVGGFGVAEFLR